MLTLLCAVFSTVWGETVTMTSFSSISGAVADDPNVSYEAQKGAAGTAPAIYNNEVRVYQNGGIFKVTANNGAKIQSITLGSSEATKVTYKIDEGSESSSQSISKNGKLTVNNQNCTVVLFTCKGTDKNSRLNVNYLSVTYESGDPNAVAKPTFSPAAGEVAEGTDVTIYAADGCTLSYTVNGGAAQTSASNTATVTINEATTIVAKAVKGEYQSDEVTAVYTVKESVPTDGFWVLTPASELKTGDIVIIADKYSSRAMANDKGTSSAPTAVSVTLNDDKTKLTTENADILSWIVTVDGSAYKFKLVGEDKNLFCKSDNNGVRVGTDSNNSFTMKENFLYNSGVNRYVGVYSNQDWRCYTTNSGNIANTEVAFYKHTKEENIKPQPNLAISDVVLDLGNTANLEVSSLSDGDITFEYSTQGIATIEKNGENYTVSTTSAGTTTVTAVQAATDTYASETVTFTVKVNPVKPEGALFYETFSSVNGAGGRDDNFGETSTSSLGQANTQNLTDEENWIFYDKNGNAGNYTIGGAQCVKIGNTTDDKKLETRSINLTGDGVLTFNAAGWYKNTNDLKVTATGGTLSGDTQVTLTNSTWNAYTVNITGATGNLVLTFEGCCGFIDDILVMPTTTPQPDAPVIWMTYSSNNSLDFTNATAYTAFVATNYKSEEKKVVLTKIKQVPAGVGIVIRSNDPTVGISSIFSEAVVLAEETYPEYAGVNMLVGMPDGGAVSPEGFMAYDNETQAYHFVLAKRDGVVGFYKLTAGNLRANRAYLQIPKSAIDTESSANGISFAVEGEETAIQGVSTTATTDDAWYTLQGVRVAQPTRGLYIHNGKKVVVK